MTNNISCFHKNTKVLAYINEKEVYTPIHTLKKGNLVKAYKHGYKPIIGIGKKKIVNNVDLLERSKNNLYLLSKEKFPELIEDLILTGCHSLLVDDLSNEQKESILENYNNFYITDDKYRLETYLELKAEPYKLEKDCEIWHLALENENYTHNYGIWANGLLVETISERYLKEYSNMTLIE